MRIGFNPNKDKVLSQPQFFHQVIVPVHIPNRQGYFSDSFEILRFCLESLFKTCHSKTFFTIVNNGSCKEVADYLDQLTTESKIQEVIHTTSIGKLNAILKGLAGHDFPLVTITDADVLFLKDWQKETYSVFEAFPKAGVVSPVPNSKSLRYFTSNLICDTFFKSKSRFVRVKEADAMKAFAESIGNPDLFNAVHLDKILAVEKKTVLATVGAGHFVATYRGECFNQCSERFSKYSLGGDSEELLLDKPASKLGLWRLSTYGNYAFHMGNVKEDWMQERLNQIPQNDFACDHLKFENKLPAGWQTILKTEFFSRIIFRKPFWQLYLRFKGLNSDEARKY